MTPLKYIIALSAFTLLVALGIFATVKYITSSGMPSLEELENPKQSLASQVYSSDGVLLDHFYYEKRVNLPYDSIPKDFVNALVSTEDKRFWNHWGVHLGRVFNVVLKNMVGDREGASTITMQLARNLFLNRELSFTRKIREAVVALQIEKTYTKKEIIELYSNTVSFGKGAYGIQVASQVYFDKAPQQMTTAECALLIGMLKAPSGYNPVNNYDKALARRNLVLKLMYDQGYIGYGQYINAAKEGIVVFKSDRESRKRRRLLGNELAPHFVEMLRQELSKDQKLSNFDLYRDGLVIHTTLNSKIQRYANEVVEEHLTEFQKNFEKSWNWNSHKTLLTQLIKKAISDRPDYKASNDSEKNKIFQSLSNNQKFIDSVKNVATTVQIGMVVIEPSTGAVLAMVGASPKFMAEHPESKYSLNHAVQIRRQPGSSFKPFVYTCALQNGYTPETMVECGPFTYTLPTGEVWSPSGTGDCGPGQRSTLRHALSLSINTVSARLVTSITNPQEVVTLAHRMGVTSGLQAVPAISLGAGGDVSPIEMISSYGTFANNGVHIPPYIFSRVDDQMGSLIKENRKSLEITEAITPEIASQMTYLLQGVVDAGTASRAVRTFFKGVDAAGKTGTTNDAADAWFIGYTPQLVCGIWMGFDNKKITFDALEGEGYGGRAAAPIFGKLMAKIYDDYSIQYKQRRFAFNRNIDSTDSTGTIYPVTPRQQELNPGIRETRRNQPNVNNNQNNNQAILPPLQNYKRRDTSRLHQ